MEQKLSQKLNDKAAGKHPRLNEHNKFIKGGRIFMLEIAYKKNVDDKRESTSVGIMKLMQELGAIVEYLVPYVSVFPKMRRHHFALKGVGLSIDTLKTYDCIVIFTNHDDFDYTLLRKYACLIKDTRDVYLGTYGNVIHA